ncbi:g6894 [Coccomyxa elongata]
MGGSEASSEVSSGTSTSDSNTDDRKRRDVDGEVQQTGSKPETAGNALSTELPPDTRSVSPEDNSSPGRGRRRERNKKDKKEKLKKTKKNKKSKDKDREKKRKRKSGDREKRKGPVQLSKHIYGDGEKYSVISGKKIRLKIDKTKEDIEAERKRKDLLASLNEIGVR